MRAIFVNHCHPDCPHVCGTRAREFAGALARQGHQIVLLTETLRRTDGDPDPVQLPAAIAAHNWRSPFRLAVRPGRALVLEALRAGRLPAPVRAAIITYQYLVRGGMFTDWRDASHKYWRPLATFFRPELVWGVFGNTDAWAIAQGIARMAGCPWVRDMKDQWTVFIPAPFRAHLSRQYADSSAATALSAANASDAAPWFATPADIVYSGLPADLLAARIAPANSPFAVTLIGAVYEERHLRTFVEGLRRFASTPGRRKPSLIYAGMDVGAVMNAVAGLTGMVDVKVQGQMPFHEYWKAICRSHLNIYVRSTKTGWWHHKIVELLAARQPILCIPGEANEALALARQVKGQILAAADPDAVAAVLDRAEAGGSAPAPDEQELRLLTWDARSAELLAVLGRLAR